MPKTEKRRSPVEKARNRAKQRNRKIPKTKRHLQRRLLWCGRRNHIAANKQTLTAVQHFTQHVAVKRLFPRDREWCVSACLRFCILTRFSSQVGYCLLENVRRKSNGQCPSWPQTPQPCFFYYVAAVAFWCVPPSILLHLKPSLSCLCAAYYMLHNALLTPCTKHVPDCRRPYPSPFSLFQQRALFVFSYFCFCRPSSFAPGDRVLVFSDNHSPRSCSDKGSPAMLTGVAGIDANSSCTSRTIMSLATTPRSGLCGYVPASLSAVGASHGASFAGING
jgi:hypothetical protein